MLATCSTMVVRDGTSQHLEVLGDGACCGLLPDKSSENLTYNYDTMSPVIPQIRYLSGVEDPAYVQSPSKCVGASFGYESCLGPFQE